MPNNKIKILVTETMSPNARALLTERDDIEVIEFPNLISAKDFEALLKKQAPVHGVALGATRFGEPELSASKDMKVVTRIGVVYDAVHVPADAPAAVTANAPLASVVAEKVCTAPPPVGRNTRLTGTSATPWLVPATTRVPDALPALAVRVRVLGCWTGAGAAEVGAAAAVEAAGEAVGLCDGVTDVLAATDGLVVAVPDPVEAEQEASRPAASTALSATAGIVRLFMV